jgi:hypothetical protein
MAAVIADTIARPTSGRRPPVPPMKISVPPGATVPTASRPTRIGRRRWASTSSRALSRSISMRGA